MSSRHLRAQKLPQSLAHREFLCGDSYAAHMAHPSLSCAATVVLCVAAVALLDVCLPGALYEGPKTEGGVVPIYTDNAVAHCLFVNVAFLFALSQLSASQTTFAELASTLNVGALVFCAWFPFVMLIREVLTNLRKVRILPTVRVRC